jgi:hypothetical protein
MSRSTKKFPQLKMSDNYVKSYKKKNINVNDSQNLSFATSHFIIELLPFDYFSNQKQRVNKKNAFQEE